MVKRAAELAGKLRGVPAVVLGNSPALNQVDLRLLDPFVTIGVNRILRAYTPQFVLYCDAGVTTKELQWFQRYRLSDGRPGRFLLWDRLKNWAGKIPGDEVYGWSLNGKRVEAGDTLRGDDNLYISGTTPGYALQLCWLWGCDPIGLLGVDFNAKELVKDKKPSHFFGNGRDVGSNGGGLFRDANRQFYTWFREKAVQSGRRVFNLSPIDDAPFHQAGWGRMTLQEFHDQFARTLVEK